ncbi:YciI family protein [Haloechinothrix sp. LS1_15]|uniref:YciI family protein n=1 Tax=Haloechinothrix sp. LS1_15 TaxID=2652248 RepID=UPI00294665E2|nr:YciI family protein [Haloechinothrix sp. LS1_15]MDV6011171.1 hypothetical protein [Haloechinothrix sp. LS1_15]
MAWYLVEIQYVQDKLAEVRPRHREFVRELAEQGRVAVAGPLADDSGGIMLVQADDLDDLHAVIDTDPYYTEDAIAHRSIREYKPVLGSWVP